MQGVQGRLNGASGVTIRRRGASSGRFASGKTQAGRHRRTQSYVSTNQLSLLTSYYLLLKFSGAYMRLRLPRQPGTHARTVAPPAYSSGLALRTGARPSVLPSPSPSERLAVEVSARSRGREARSRVAPWPPWPPSRPKRPGLPPPRARGARRWPAGASCACTRPRSASPLPCRLSGAHPDLCRHRPWSPCPCPSLRAIAG